MTFVIRKLNDAETLGQKLKALRLSIPRTISEMAEKSKLRRGLIEAFEADRHDQLPAPLYTRQFLKRYVAALEGDVDYFLERYEAECGACDFTHATRLPRLRVRAAQFLVASRFVKFGVLGAVALALCAYLGTQLQAITSPPAIVVYAPTDGMATDDATITVFGRADGETSVRVNDLEVLLGQDGTFEAEVALKRGLNVIRVEGAKRYSRIAVEERRVVLDQDRQIGFGN